MRELLQGIALGVLLATGILAFVFYKNPPEVVTKEKEYTVEDAVSYLESQDYEVVKKDTEQSMTTEEKQPEQTEEKEDGQQEIETEKAIEKEDKVFQLVIESGMSSIAVAELLYDNGIVDDASAFNEYLGNHGYQQVIRIGSYQLSGQMSYEEIADIITN